MDTKNQITREVFDAIRAEYDEALDRRRLTIRQQKKDGWTQQRIANHWGLDISRVNKIIKAMEANTEKKG
jgi:hypothetical protein